MAIWHCPVCGLDFAFHSELDWHVREAHCLKRTAGLAGQLERQAVLDWGLLRRLQSVDGAPSVSLLLWTTPAAVMTPSDAADLHQLAELAVERLAGEVRGEARRHMELRLQEALRAAEHSPTDHGLAVFVSPNETAVVPLPFSPREKSRGEPRFCYPRPAGRAANVPDVPRSGPAGPGFRLLEGRAERLSEVVDWQVPNPSIRRARGSAWTPRHRRHAALAEADRAIGVRVAVLGRLPLVVIGRNHLLAEFRKRSPHASSVVGEVRAWGSMLSKASVAQLATPLIRTWREQHTQRYLDALAEADRNGVVVWDLEKVWDAVVAGEVERVWVERDYWSPARLGDRGNRLLPPEAKEAHRVVPDIIDVIIERAALAGAHVEIVHRLSEGEGPRIAAQLGHPPGQDESSDLDALLEQARMTSWSPATSSAEAPGKQLAHG